jgi:hypothetical protein
VELQQLVGWTAETPLEEMMGAHAVKFYHQYMADVRFRDKKVFDCSQDPVRADGAESLCTHCKIRITIIRCFFRPPGNQPIFRCNAQTQAPVMRAFRAPGRSGNQGNFSRSIVCTNFPSRGAYGKTDLKDGCLPTLTTNCRCMMSAVHCRPMSELELLLNVGVPLINRAANAAGVPPVKFEGISRQAQAFMAGNSMHVPSVGAVLLAAMMCIVPK